LIEAEEASKLKNLRQDVDFDAKAEKLIKKLRPGDYQIIQIGDKSERKFLLEHRDGNKVTVQVKVSHDGTVEYEGLPNEFTYLMNSFSN
jgi:capsule polysaccharide export protein KpsC/LpsZ